MSPLGRMERGIEMRKVAILAWAVVLGIALGVGTAWAGPIEPGFDLLHTPAGGSVVDLGLGIGVVSFQGLPISAELGTTDTIIERTGGLGDGGTGPIDAEIIALSLQSTSPVNIGGTDFDVFVTLDTSMPSIGTVDILTHDGGGGTFSSFFDVFTEVSFVGGGAPFSVLRHDTLVASATPWSHTAAPMYPDNPGFPGGGFFITEAGIQHEGPHRTVVPATIAEPSTLLLLGFGLAGVGAAARRRFRPR